MPLGPPGLSQAVPVPPSVVWPELPMPAQSHGDGDRAVSGPWLAVMWAGGGTSPPLSFFRIAGSGEKKSIFGGFICFSSRVDFFFFFFLIPLLILNGPKPLVPGPGTQGGAAPEVFLDTFILG